MFLNILFHFFNVFQFVFNVFMVFNVFVFIFVPMFFICLYVLKRFCFNYFQGFSKLVFLFFSLFKPFSSFSSCSIVFVDVIS